MKINIGIIGALDEELNLYYKKLVNKKKIKKAGFIFYFGKIENKDAVIVKSGIGKVNVSICTQMLISEFDCSLIIFTGVAGALNPNLKIGDIVISKDSIQHDMDAKKLGFEKGEIPFTGLKNIKASKDLIKKTYNIAKKLGLKSIIGRNLTGDQFITDKVKANLIKEEFSGDCIDMESAALAYICHINKIPHVIIRSISDKADHSASVDFTKFSKKVPINSFNIVKELIKQIPKPEKQNLNYIKSKIRTIPNFPKPGIMFRDITTLFKEPKGIKKVINVLYPRYKNQNIDIVAGIESRGFIIGGSLSEKLECSFVPIRKKGKLPFETLSQNYNLEYGTNTVEIHKDAIKKGQKILLIDDLIATGGTALASAQLIEKLGGQIHEIAFIIDLPDLKGKEKLTKWPVFAMIEFKGK